MGDGGVEIIPPCTKFDSDNDINENDVADYRYYDTNFKIIMIISLCCHEISGRSILCFCEAPHNIDSWW